MNKNNYVFYAIIIYIIIIIYLIIKKPDFIYDHNNFKFKKFGYSKDKTLFPINILALILSVIIITIFSSIGKEKYTEKNIFNKNDLYNFLGGNMHNIQYIPYILQYQIPQITQPQIIQQ